MGVERLVAGVLVIGLVVWGASVLATPDDWVPSPEAEPTGDAAQPAGAPESSAPDAAAPAKVSATAAAAKIGLESKQHEDGKGHAKKVEKRDGKKADRGKGGSHED